MKYVPVKDFEARCCHEPRGELSLQGYDGYVSVTAASVCDVGGVDLERKDAVRLRDWLNEYLEKNG